MIATPVPLGTAHPLNSVNVPKYLCGVSISHYRLGRVTRIAARYVAMRQADPII